MAFAFGYEQLNGEQPFESDDDLPVIPVTNKIPSPIAKLIERPHKLPRAVFFYIAERKRKQADDRQNSSGIPEWFEKAEILSEDACAESGTLRLPAYPPLIRWPRLWPFLRMVLGQTTVSRQTDIPRLIRDVARGLTLHHLPMQTQHGWSAKICILLDFQTQTEPFYHDYNSLWGRLKKLHGSLGMDLRILHGEAGLQTQYRNPRRDEIRHWQMPAIDTPLLILSDLGLLAESPQQRQGWERFGRRLRAAGCKPLVMCPVPEALHDKRLLRLFTIHTWDRNSRLRGNSASSVNKREKSEHQGAELLLVLLSAAVVVEPALLRAVRNYCLPFAWTWPMKSGSGSTRISIAALRVAVIKPGQQLRSTSST